MTASVAASQIVDRSIPRHVAIIMDGNGRWARARGKSRQYGHRAGTENIRRIIEQFAARSVPYLTLYAFSTENWSRPPAEVRALMRVLALALKNEVANFHRNNIRLVHIGDLDPLPKVLRRQVVDSLALTANNTRMTVCVAFNYGGRADIVHAIRGIIAEGIPAEQVDDAVVGAHLYTAGIPDPDLVIRTAGEVRLSNFLLWQAAYAELYSTPVLWPDFDAEQVDRALEEYARRTRKFGAVVDPPPARGRRAGAAE